MSDLIDFDSPVANNVGLLLASPLIPAPQNPKSDGSDLSEAGPRFLACDKRRSMENNPFDMVMKKITDYEKNKEDPFEKVIQKAMGFNGRPSIESKDDYIPKRTRYSDVLKMNKTFDETESNLDLPSKGERIELVREENNMSIITDLNNTNLISDNIDKKQVVLLWNCDKKIIPDLIVTSPPCNKDLSILNNSSMNDSLLEHDNTFTKELKNLHNDLKIRPRSMSQNNVSPIKLSAPTTCRRSMSVTDTLTKNNIFEDNNTINSIQSNVFEDPLNNAFRKSSCNSNINSSSSLCNQFDSFINPQKMERLNSDSSVFSGLSSISSIPPDVSNNRFYSESSVLSGISNLSTIPAANSTLSSCGSSVFTNDTINKGFINSKSQLNLSTPVNKAKTPLKSVDNSDLIKKFYEIKTRMSTSHIESNSLSNHNIMHKIDNVRSPEGKLIDIDNSSDSLNDGKNVNDVISQEAKALAEVFEKMALSSNSISTTEDDLLLSKTSLNFDDLPPSDDETENNLIDLPTSPIKNTTLPKVDAATETTPMPTAISSKDDIKALENEFVEQKNCDKKAVTATLFLELEKLIEEENNPHACKVLNDLQKMLGVECKSNTQILQRCLENVNTSPENEKKFVNEKHSNESVPDNNRTKIDLEENVQNIYKTNLFSTEEHSENKENSSNSDNCQLNVVNDSDKRVTENLKAENESQNVKESVENKENSNETSKDQKLAINLLKTLNKIVNEENEDSAVDILRSLGEVLNMATELRTKNKEKQNSEIKKLNKSAPKQLNRSTNSIQKTVSPKKHTKLQNKTFEVLPLRRSISTNPSCNNNALDVPSAKDKRKSHLLTMKRFPSDPGLVNPAIDKKSNGSPPKVVEQKSSPEEGKSKIEPVKTKFKKKANPETITKKGPLKAVIPLGNMQKRESINQRVSVHIGNVTPPKLQNSVPTLNIISSTPNSSGVCKKSKSKPTTSTPNIEGLRSQRAKTPTQQNSKNAATCNASPVSLNNSLKVSITAPKVSTKRMERTLSPQKRTRKNSESSSESRVPRYSPRPVRVRNYSMDDLKTAKSPQTNSVIPKVSSEKKIQRNTVLSPLRNSNKLVVKGKPMNLVSRLGKHSGIQNGPEKENYI